MAQDFRRIPIGCLLAYQVTRSGMARTKKYQKHCLHRDKSKTGFPLAAPVPPLRTHVFVMPATMLLQQQPRIWSQKQQSTKYKLRPTAPQFYSVYIAIHNQGEGGDIQESGQCGHLGKAITTGYCVL